MENKINDVYELVNKHFENYGKECGEDVFQFLPNIYDYVRNAILNEEDEQEVLNCADEDYADAIICELEVKVENGLEQLKQNNENEKEMQ